MAKPVRLTQEEIAQRQTKYEQERQELLQLPDEEFIVTKHHTFDGLKYYYKLKSNKKWGHFKWQHLYNNAKNYREGVAAINIDGKWGFIDKTGDIIIPCKYDEALYFRNGFAAVSINGKWGFVDVVGNEVAPFKYDGVDKTYHIHYGKGIIVWQNKKFGYVIDGNEIISCKYDKINPFTQDGLACVKLNGKYGYINTQGEEVIPLIYDETKGISDGLVCVSLNGKYGYINIKGKEVIPFMYDYADSFREGLAKVGYRDTKKSGINGKFGYIDTAGNEVIPLKFDSADDFHNGLASVWIDGKHHEIDRTGRIINYDIKSTITDKGLQSILAEQLRISSTVYSKCNNGKYEAISSTPNKYTPKNRYEIIGKFYDGLASAKRNGKWGFITKDYIEIISCKYEDVFDFVEEHARVKLNGKWGIINKDGRYIIHCIYDWLNDFHEGLVAAEYKGKWGYLNSYGGWEIVRSYSFAGDFSNGKARVKRKLLFGLEETFYIDKDGYKINY